MKKVVKAAGRWRWTAVAAELRRLYWMEAS
jgi:hypothetical protein